MRDDDEWKFYEIEWLRTLVVPLIFGRVDSKNARLDLYSLGPVWRVLWQIKDPFLIECVTAPASSEPYVLTEETREAAKVAVGDGHSWTVNLGPPFLSLTHGALPRGMSLQNASALLKRYLRIDRENLIRYQIGVAVHSCVLKWSTNEFSVPFEYDLKMYWSYTPGANIDRLVGVLAPVVANLGLHLEAQHNADVSRLVDILRWLNDQGALDQIGINLLNRLTDHRS